MTRARPGREQEKQLRPALARDGAALVGLEMRERPGWRLDLLAAGTDARASLDDEEPRVLLDLMVAELLPRVEPDEHGARLVLTQENDRRTAAARRVDLGQLPGLHRAKGV